MHLPVRLKISLVGIVIKHSPDMGVVVGSLFFEIRRSLRTLRSSSNVLAVWTGSSLGAVGDCFGTPW